MGGGIILHVSGDWVLGYCILYSVHTVRTRCSYVMCHVSRIYFESPPNGHRSEVTDVKLTDDKFLFWAIPCEGQKVFVCNLVLIERRSDVRFVGIEERKTLSRCLDSNTTQQPGEPIGRIDGSGRADSSSSFCYVLCAPVAQVKYSTYVMHALGKVIGYGSGTKRQVFALRFGPES